ncbi:hypothetical protein MMC07_009333 [Pseudocyphellaria aurata]|nr:hypothetical protein [Pseudocyphellaria aurata]
MATSASVSDALSASDSLAITASEKLSPSPSVRSDSTQPNKKRTPDVSPPVTGAPRKKKVTTGRRRDGGKAVDTGHTKPSSVVNLSTGEKTLDPEIASPSSLRHVPALSSYKDRQSEADLVVRTCLEHATSAIEKIANATRRPPAPAVLPPSLSRPLICMPESFWPAARRLHQLYEVARRTSATVTQIEAANAVKDKFTHEYEGTRKLDRRSNLGKSDAERASDQLAKAIVPHLRAHTQLLAYSVGADMNIADLAPTERGDDDGPLSGGKSRRGGRELAPGRNARGRFD